MAQTTITVNVPKSQIIDLFITVLMDRAKENEDYATCWAALSLLPGRSDVEAVKRANKWADEHAYKRINTDFFRKWLSFELSAIFSEHLEEKNGG